MSPTKENTPAMTFEAFLVSLATATMVSLGEMPNPMTKKKEKDLESAKNHIDILEILATKTKGNLTTEEDQLMSQVLHTVRLKFLEQKKS